MATRHEPATATRGPHVPYKHNITPQRTGENSIAFLTYGLVLTAICFRSKHYKTINSFITKQSKSDNVTRL